MLFRSGNPDLYYTIGNASTMISAMALPMSGILKGATGAAKFKTIAVDGGRILIGNVAEDKVYDAIYQSTDSRILAMLGSNVVEGVLSGNPANSSVSEVGDVARKTDIEELGDNLIDLRRKGFEGVSEAAPPPSCRGPIWPTPSWAAGWTLPTAPWRTRRRGPATSPRR